MNSMLKNTQRAAIVDGVDEAFDQQIAFTQELIRHPSVRTREASAQDVMERALKERGFTIDRWQLDPAELSEHVGHGRINVSYEGMTNVVGTFQPAQHTGRSLILNGHIDVVPVGPREQWSRSPWDPHVEDGWLYGRGCGDMKAGLAGGLFAIDAIRAAGLEITAPLHFQSVVEEESTGNGTLAAIQRGYTAEAVLIPEPEENMLVRANVGVIWAKIRVGGKPTHPREMTSGFNAIDAAVAVVNQLRLLEAEWNAERGRHRHFEDLDHPINFNIGQIRGGDWPSSVPAWCEFDLRAALYPGTTADEAWEQIMRHLKIAEAALPVGDARVTAEKTGFYAEGYVLEEGSDAEHTLGEQHEKVFGSPLDSFTTPGYIDSRLFVLYSGLPTLVYGPRTEEIHGYDERTHLESLRKVTKTMALFIAEWCGVTQTS
ncbi:ArgE/DapE family deacylase [Streptomyces iranensis]|uniref:Acetylornithine deacetylase n=1 Tax=Streptomyces iranensis TaxID=576784 RepID=A0A060ZHT4_9ACTN|nr:ArgE/DapE family deacylase [Streptomyces iranensis]MBP2061148.1 acetylornithine deacetylase [Streptomyces iranensis]CDR05585.1 peptidase M20 [Streptomyces iranensis]